jgi:hypothetical protein
MACTDIHRLASVCLVELAPRIVVDIGERLFALGSALLLILGQEGLREIVIATLWVEPLVGDGRDPRANGVEEPPYTNREPALTS